MRASLARWIARGLVPVMLCACAADRSWAIEFEDPALATAVTACGGGSAIPWLPPSESDIARMIALDADGIFSLVGLEYAINLETMMVTDGTIIDAAPLASLEQLTWVDLGRNEIGDIGPLAGLVNVEILVLDGNRLADVSAVAGMTGLWWCHLEDNGIQDISPLTSLTGLGKLYLGGNPLNQQAYDTYLPLIEANNPGIDLRYDPLCPRGDADLDGDVDLDDFVILKQGFATGATWREGDFDADSDVDLDDFVILKKNFGSTAVPEPAGLLLLALGAGMASRRRKA